MNPQVPEDESSPLPPRPNLGPEPWPESDWFSTWWLLIFLPVMTLVGWRVRRARSMSRSQPAEIPMPVESPEAVSPAEKLVRLTEGLRQELVARFGANWAAMTTEEIDRTLPLKMIGLPRESIVELFRAADRVKFGDQGVEEAFLAEAEVLASVASRALADGASSNQNGQ